MKTINILLTSTLFLLFSFFANASNKSISSGLNDLFEGPILDSDGNEVSKDVLAGKTIGIYFSAHWCPPCRGFTPKLVEFRDANKKDFEVVFVSSDRNPKHKWIT